MQLKIIRDKKIPVRKYARKFFLNLPKVILYLICAKYFYVSVHELCVQFFHFNTTILIRYENPDLITFPAVTICGCDEENVICTPEAAEMPDQSVDKILNEISFAENALVSSCFFVYDSRTPDVKTPCNEIEHSVGSLHDGRKCWTYFTTLTDRSIRHTANYHQKKAKHSTVSQLKSTEQYTWYIVLEVNFTEAIDIPPRLLNSYTSFKLQDADVIVAIHSPNMIPTPLDTEFFSLDIGNLYTIHFSKQVTKLLPFPYITNCQQYYQTQKPRSQNECVNLCLLRQYSSKTTGACLNYNFIITESGLAHMKSWLPDINVSYCRDSSYVGYSHYIDKRRSCIDFCGRDCEEENYSVVTENAPLTHDSGYNATNTSLVMIRPDKKLHELVEHKSDLDFFQFIGYLGGHAHIWLGLSAIQLYDVVYGLIVKIKFFWERFVEW